MDDFFKKYREIIPGFDDFIESLNQPTPIHLRVNTLKVNPEKLVDILENRGIRLKPMGDDGNHFYEASNLKSSGNLPEYFSGFIHPQALTSCLASTVLAPERDSLVLDLCSSPGGKTAHMAAIMGNSGVIVANELYASRHIPLGHTLTRLGVLNAIYTAYQAQEFPLRQRFDYISADVPCSGEGRIRRVEGVRNNYPIKQDSGRKLFDVQKKIILRGFDLLSDNGVMVYSTCTYNPDENEAVIQYLLQNRAAELLPIDTSFPHSRGLTCWKDITYDTNLKKTARFYPHHTNSVGFFMARIGKRRG